MNVGGIFDVEEGNAGEIGGRRATAIGVHIRRKRGVLSFEGMGAVPRGNGRGVWETVAGKD